MEKGILKLTSKQLSYLSKAINAERFGQEEVNNTSRNTLTAQEHDELNESINRLLCVVKHQPLERIPEDKTVVDDSSRSDSLRLAETPVERLLEETRPTGKESGHTNGFGQDINVRTNLETPTNGEETKSQSGEREELERVRELLRRKLPIGAFTDLYEEVTDNREDRVLGYVTCGERVLDDYAKVVLELLSESKKEGVEEERIRIWKELDNINCVRESYDKGVTASGMQYGIIRAEEIVLNKLVS